MGTGAEFQDPELWLDNFGSQQGWSATNDLRQAADVNSDGVPDIVGFGRRGVEVPLGTGFGFESPTLWTEAFNSGTWTPNDSVRVLSDINGDGLTDVVGRLRDRNPFVVAMGTGTGFAPATSWARSFNEWSPRYLKPRILDVSGNGRPDIVGFNAVGLAWSHSRHSRLRLGSVTDGMGHLVRFEYSTLTDSNVYTKGTGSVFPVVDYQGALDVIAKTHVDNGVGGLNPTTYHYHGYRLHLQGMGHLGFKKVETTDEVMGIRIVREFSQAWDQYKTASRDSSKA